MYKYIFIMLLSLFCFSCYSDNGVELVKSQPIDANNTTFKGNILPLLEANCNGCHSTANALSAGANVILDNHTEVLKYINDGSLYGSISHDGFSPMPKGSNKLSANTLQTFDVWIKNGAKNN